MSEADITDPSPSDAQTPRRSRRGIGLVVLIVLVAGGAGAAWFGGFLGAPGEPVEVAPRLAPPIYFEIESNMVVNFQGGGRMRYLQVGIQAMARDPAVIEALKAHNPAIRNALIMLLSEQTHEALSTREGKDALRADALAEVRRILPALPGGAVVEDMYFTNFVMQ